ncbi:MAG: M16 family metallopeptidase [Candidatus Acidiferrales bacterium]
MRAVKHQILSPVLCALALAVAVASLPAQTKQAQAKGLRVEYKEFKLKNGMRVILSEDHNAPTYSLAVIYDVGSRNEREGRTGFAHLFEHMMFQGSANVAKREHTETIQLVGGAVNGTTNNDRTLYFEMLPSNQLDLALWLEADRMRALNVTQENLDNQRNAVQEERRLRIDNQPYGPTFLAIDETVYDNFAYKHSVIGSMADLSAANLNDVKEFFRIYYAPNNATLALVGDFKTEEALAKIKKYFEDIPSQPKAPEVDLTEPSQKGERRRTLEDKFARTPRLDIVYKIPNNTSPDWYALDVAGDVLVRGQSSRLYQKLVREKQLAVNVFGGPDSRRGTSTFSFAATLRPGVDPAEVEKLIYAEIDKVQAELVSEKEIAKIFMQNRRTRAQSLTGTLARAIQLAEAAVAHNDPNFVNTWLDKYSKVKASDIQRVAQKYWQENNRTVLTTTVKAAAASGNGAQ